MARFVGHLPWVELASGLPYLGARHGRIRSLSFDEWYRLDGRFTFARSEYERTSPCFLEIDVTGSASMDEELAAFHTGADRPTAALRQCYEALLLVSAARLPSPAMSMAYWVLDEVDPGGPAGERVSFPTLRRSGPAQRELIVHGGQHARVLVDGEDAHSVQRASTLLESRGELMEPVVDALVRTSRPGFTPVNEAMHLVAGLEAVLVDESEPQASTFARRCAVLRSEDDLSADLDRARLLYRIRSDVIHGRPISPVPDSWREFVSAGVRSWTCAIALRALSWLDANPLAGVEDLRASLDDAWQAADVPSPPRGDGAFDD